jgi:DNA-directed RNA polymerase subunit RPC12/RpoP
MDRMKINIQVHDCGFSKEMDVVCPSCGEKIIKNKLPDPNTTHQMERADAFRMAQTKINQVLLIKIIELEQMITDLRTRCKNENK